MFSLKCCKLKKWDVIDTCTLDIWSSSSPSCNEKKNQQILHVVSVCIEAVLPVITCSNTWMWFDMFCFSPSAFTYVIRFFIGYGLGLSRVLPLTIYHLKRKYVCKTQTELEEAWAPGAFSYHTNVPNDLLIATIALCYSVIAPLVLVFALLYFGIGWVVNRHQVHLIQDPKQSFRNLGKV